MTLSGNIVNANRARKVRNQDKARDMKARIADKLDPARRTHCLDGAAIAALVDADRIARIAAAAAQGDESFNDPGRLLAFRVNDPGADDHGSLVPLSAVAVRFAGYTRRGARQMASYLRGMTPVFEENATDEELEALLG